MNLKNWKRDHTYGMLLGMVTPLIVVPLVLVLFSFLENHYFEMTWHRFKLNTPFQIKMITLSIIANLIWFYIFLNRERYQFAMGIILGSLAYGPYIVYIKFF